LLESFTNILKKTGVHCLQYDRNHV